MKTNTDLITELLNVTAELKSRLTQLRRQPLEVLNKKADSVSWSALECIEHLNLYGDFYLPEIENRIMSATKIKEGKFKSGVWGGYFVRLMKPGKNGAIKKMKSPTDKQPASSGLTELTLDRFSKQLDRLEDLIKRSAFVDLAKTKTAISLTKLIRLRLGDTLQFVVYHAQRHINQALRTSS